MNIFKIFTIIRLARHLLHTNTLVLKTCQSPLTGVMWMARTMSVLHATNTSHSTVAHVGQWGQQALSLIESIFKEKERGL